MSVFREGRAPERVKRWRRQQKSGSIMKPSTFKRIEEDADERGYDDPKSVAGAAYWRTAMSKFKERAKRSRRGKDY